MNKRYATSIALATLAPMLALAATPRSPEASRQVFNDVNAHLDPGGDLMVVANVDGLLEKAVALIKDAASVVPAAALEGTDITGTIDKVSAFLKANGFYAVKGLGFSSVPRADGRHDIKTFMARDAAAARLPLWMALVGGDPSLMRIHAYLPKDTVFARSGTGDPKVLWQLIRSGVAELGGSEAVQGMQMGLDMFASQAGVSADALIASMAAEGAIALQLSSTATATIPVDGALAIPAPSLLIIMAVNDSTIIDSIKRSFATALAMPLPEMRVGDATVYNVPIPIPAPFPVQLTLATHGNYLLIGTSSDVVNSALDAATKGGGLKSMPEFTAAFTSAEPNNGIQFVSRRLGDAIRSVRDQSVGQNAPGEEFTAMIDLLKSLEEGFDTSAAFTFYNHRTGVQVSGVSASGGQQVIGSALALPVGIMAGIAIPSFVRARTMSTQNACINNLRMIDSAKEQWAMEMSKNDGDPVVNPAVEQYMKGLTTPVCPEGGTYTYGPIGTAPTCSHPGHEL